MDFSKVKTQRLDAEDLSRKGSIDEEIVSLVTFMNDQENYCTTSSCSGRLAIFSENEESSKKGCKWLLISHKQLNFEDVKPCIYDSQLESTAVFKFEPFVLHVQCRALEDAKLMHQVAVESGFRNSGITIGKNGKIMAAVRSTHGLEVPLANNGTVLVTPEYVKYLLEIANSKMEENSRRIIRFFSNLQNAVKLSTQENAKETSKSKRKSKLKGQLDRTCKMRHQSVQCNLTWMNCPHNSHHTYCHTCCSEACKRTQNKQSGRCDSGTWVDCEDVEFEETDEGHRATDDLDDLEMGFQILEVDS